MVLMEKCIVNGEGTHTVFDLSRWGAGETLLQEFHHGENRCGHRPTFESVACAHFLCKNDLTRLLLVHRRSEKTERNKPKGL